MKKIELKKHGRPQKNPRGEHFFGEFFFKDLRVRREGGLTFEDFPIFFTKITRFRLKIQLSDYRTTP